MLSSITAKLASATAIGLVAALTATGASTPAAAAETCPGMSPTENSNSANVAPTLTADTATTQSGGSVVIHVLDNDSDPDGDTLFVTGTSKPARGTTCVGKKGLIRYTPDVWKKDRTDTFTYGVTDGDRYRTATVTVAVDGLAPVKPQVTKRLILGKGGKVKQRAVVTFTNTNSRRMWFLAGNPRKNAAEVSRFLYPGRSFSFSTKERRLAYYSLIAPRNGDLMLVNIGQVNTRTGVASSHYIAEWIFVSSEESDYRQQSSAAREVWNSRAR